jgi:hypothetical protein
MLAAVSQNIGCKIYVNCPSRKHRPMRLSLHSFGLEIDAKDPQN